MKINRNAAGGVMFCTLEYGDVFTFMEKVFMVVCDDDIGVNAVNLETFILTDFINDALVIPHPNASLTLE